MNEIITFDLLIPPLGNLEDTMKRRLSCEDRKKEESFYSFNKRIIILIMKYAIAKGTAAWAVLLGYLWFMNT